MKFQFQPKLFVASLLVCSVAGLLLSYFSGISYWWALAIVVGALLVNGLVAEVEDQSSGMFERTAENEREPQ